MIRMVFTPDEAVPQPTKMPPVPPSPLGERVYKTIRDAILSGKMDSGGWLKQQTLAHELQVSQATVREALQRLVLEGLAVHIPYKGVRLVQVSKDSLRDLYELRALLDGFASELAAIRISPKLPSTSCAGSRLTREIDSGWIPIRVAPTGRPEQRRSTCVRT